jgi:hypothetical protein
MTTKSPPSQARRPIRVAQVIFAGAATIASLALLTGARPGVVETGVALGSVRLADQATALSAPATGLAGGSAKDDPGDPGWSPPVDPGPSYPTSPGWSTQPDPGWNAEPGWDFQPSP